MKAAILSLCAVAVLIAQSKALPQTAGEQASPVTSIKVTRLRQEEAARLRSEGRARMKQSFERGRELLERHGVPFEPEMLLSRGWRKLLAPILAQMPEMQTTRRLGPRLKGVQLADTLYLPEKVELIGDTVVIARQLIFEGRHAVVKGNYAVYIYPIETDGVLGATLETAMREQGVRHAGGGRIEKAAFNGALPPEGFTPRLLQKDWSITIDTSGQGAREWREKQERARKTGFAKTGLQTTIDYSGEPGATGLTGDPGMTGAYGSPDPARAGDDGVCGSPDGLRGFPGIAGGTGGVGNLGGRGVEGGDATEIGYAITNPMGTYHFLARGGGGGDGGRGGDGGTGGNGAQGGKGGEGANCLCEQGGAGDGGDGGNGGQGGRGGKGGKGGDGGLGGDGADAYIKRPANFVGLITYGGNGGVGGREGQGGSGGAPGAPGPGGDPGRGASNFNCASGSTKNGVAGTTASQGAFGEFGDPGISNQALRGAKGEIHFEDAVAENCAPECDWSTMPTCPASKPIMDNCACTCVSGSPIVVDVAGDGFNLTDARGGVLFDLNGDGYIEQLSWTAPSSDDAWLALDRDGNGKITSGRELFGNFTQQAATDEPNGFLALSEFDGPQRRGNSDGLIDERDAVFGSLLLWQDANHNGVSERGELRSLSAAGINALELDYKESRRTDGHGNEFRYRAKLTDARASQTGRWAWDVFLVGIH